MATTPRAGFQASTRALWSRGTLELALASSLVAASVVSAADPVPVVAEAVPAEAVKTGVTLRLVSELEAIVPGEPFSVGLLIRHAPGFHSYWRAPGIVGVPWQLDWTLPPGFAAGPIQWPAPRMVKMFDYDAFGYESDTLLVVDITPPAPGSPHAQALGEDERGVLIQARATWMACADTCHPDSTHLALTLPWHGDGDGENATDDDAAPAVDRRWKEAFADARASQARALPEDWAVNIVADKEGFVLRVSLPGTLPLPLQAVFMPDENIADSAQPQRIRLDRDRHAFTVRLDRLPDMDATPAALSGILRIPGQPDHQISATVAATIDCAAGT